MRERTSLLVLFQRIIVIYCGLMPLVKVMAILKGDWLMPNLVIALGLLLLGGVGFALIKKKIYNYVYVIIGIVLISALRYYEAEWVVWLHEALD